MKKVIRACRKMVNRKDFKKSVITIYGIKIEYCRKTAQYFVCAYFQKRFFDTHMLLYDGLGEQSSQCCSTGKRAYASFLYFSSNCAICRFRFSGMVLPVSHDNLSHKCSGWQSGFFGEALVFRFL